MAVPEEDRPRVLLFGDAPGLLAAFRHELEQSDVVPVSFEEASEHPADVAIFAIRHEAARSDLTKAAQAVRDTLDRLKPGAVRVAVIQRGPSRLLPRKVLRPLAAEILHQVEAGGLRPPGTARWRSRGRTWALATIERAGLRVLRVTPT